MVVPIKHMVNPEGKLLVCGLQEAEAANAQSQPWTYFEDLFLGILYDVCSSLENKYEFINKTFNTKNLMSDCCKTQKKFNKLFVECRKSVLKQTITFDDLSQMEQENMVGVNQFFCCYTT